MNKKYKIIILVLIISAIVLAFALTKIHTNLSLEMILNPSAGLSLGLILLIALILGMMHGVTPDEHTWPITFSYSVGSYSTRKGMKAGFAFSFGFMVQRAFLTTLGFLGLAVIYKEYNLNGPIYIIVGIAMAIAGAYILNKKRYIHLPFDKLFKGKLHHSDKAELIHIPKHKREIPLKMAIIHGLIAGFGFGAYATIITFILAPQVPSLIYAPLVGLMFGVGTMIMQIIFGAIFANFARVKKLNEDEIGYIGRKTAGRTLYYGGAMFALIGLLIILFPMIDKIALSTGNHIPNLDSIGVATVLVLVVVGGIGIGNLILTMHEITSKKKKKLKK